MRGSKAASDSQFSMSVGDNVPEDDNGAKSVSEMKSGSIIELRIFSSSSSGDSWGVSSLDGVAPIMLEAVHGDGSEESEMPPQQLSKTLGACSELPCGRFP